MQVGNANLSANSTMTAQALSNTGLIHLVGESAASPKYQATLDITGAAPTILYGDYEVWGDALLEFASGGITGIAAGATLDMDGGSARVSIGAGTTNSALAKLTSNAGTLNLNSNTPNGAGDLSITTTGSFINTGNVVIDSYGGYGGTTFNIGGGLVNRGGTMTIGNDVLTANTTVTATGLSTDDQINLWGNEGLTPSYQATLDITGAAPGTLTGNLFLHGDSLVEFASGGITSIAAGVELQLDGVNSRVSIGNTKTNSALSTLSTINGTIDMEGDWDTGPGGSDVTTTTSITNVGNLQLDVYGGDGASTLAIGGTLTNKGSIEIGQSGLSADSTITATGFVNDGVIDLQGNTASQTTFRSTLESTGVAVAALNGTVYVRGDADLAFASGSITSISAGALLEIDGGHADVSDGIGSTNSALSKLTTVTGRLLIRGDSNFGAGAGSVALAGGLTIGGEVDLDEYGGDGGSTLTTASTITNTGTFIVGNTDLSAATSVTTTAIVNKGALTMNGDSSFTAKITTSGDLVNYGDVNIGSDAVLNASAANFVQYTGDTTVAGILEATLVDDEGGLMDFTSSLVSGDGTGSLRIYAGATMEFGGAVDTSHTVTFEASTGDLEIGDLAAYSGTIAGFSGGDLIDLLGVAASSETVSGHTLSLFENGVAVGSLTLSGTYKTASFTLVSDDHGGTDIVDPPTTATASKAAAATSSGTATAAAPHCALEQLVQAMASFTSNSASLASHLVVSPTYTDTHLLAASAKA